MNRQTISKLIDELRSGAVGFDLIRLIPSGGNEVALHLRDAEPPFVIISCDPKFHRILSAKRKVRDLDRAGSQSPFSLVCNRDLSGLRIARFDMPFPDRVVVIAFEEAESSVVTASLVAQMTGRSSNLFLLDKDSRITARLRDTSGDGQNLGDIYSPPTRNSPDIPALSESEEHFPTLGDESFSEAVDRHFLRLIDETNRQAAAASERAKISTELKKCRKLIISLQSDLASHGDAENWKKLGDLLLASTHTAVRDGDELIVTDYFDPESPELRIEGPSNKSISQIAEDYFKKYTKARNARDQLQTRIVEAETALAKIERRLAKFEQSVIDGSFESPIASASQRTPKTKKTPQGKTRSPFRRFVSSDGIEILVGKGSRDNDELTFKIAKSLDLWLHAADYPGSHVVIRGAGKKELPQRTILEAAMLAAFYSDAKNQPKVAVHHTQRKFVGKIKGAAPGMVRLSSFKTILVEPQIPEGISKD